MSRHCRVIISGKRYDEKKQKNKKNVSGFGQMKPMTAARVAQTVGVGLGGSSSRVVLGAAKWRENIRKSKDPGSPPDPGKLKKKNMKHL